MLPDGLEPKKQPIVVFARSLSWAPRYRLQRWEKYKQNIKVSVCENKQQEAANDL